MHFPSSDYWKFPGSPASPSRSPQEFNRAGFNATSWGAQGHRESANQAVPVKTATAAWQTNGHEGFVNIEMSKPVEKTYKSLLEPENMPGSKISTDWEKYTRKITVCSLFHAREARREHKGGYMKVGKARQWLDAMQGCPTCGPQATFGSGWLWVWPNTKS